MTTEPEHGSQHATLLDVVWSLSEPGRDDAQVAADVADAVDSDRLVLTGTFAGQHIRS